MRGSALCPQTGPRLAPAPPGTGNSAALPLLVGGRNAARMLLPAAFLPSKRDWGAGQGGDGAGSVPGPFGAGPSAAQRLSLSFSKESSGLWPKARWIRRTCATCLRSTTLCSQQHLSSTSSASCCPPLSARPLPRAGIGRVCWASSLQPRRCAPSPWRGGGLGGLWQ